MRAARKGIVPRVAKTGERSTPGAEHHGGLRLPSSVRLRFRTWQPDDLPLALELWGDARVTALISRSAWGPAQVEERLRTEMRFQETDGVQYWPFFLRTTGELAGCCGLHPRHPERGILELGFHLLPRAWGKGLATEAARAAAVHGLDHLGASALFAGHHPENAASGRVLAKLGFRYTHRERYPPTGLLHPCYLLAREELRRG
jgi:RimJ/RimL family protein N-acetyltransferase